MSLPGGVALQMIVNCFLWELPRDQTIFFQWNWDLQGKKAQEQVSNEKIRTNRLCLVPGLLFKGWLIYIERRSCVFQVFFVRDIDFFVCKSWGFSLSWFSCCFQQVKNLKNNSPLGTKWKKNTAWPGKIIQSELTNPRLLHHQGKRTTRDTCAQARKSMHELCIQDAKK